MKVVKAHYTGPNLRFFKTKDTEIIKSGKISVVLGPLADADILAMASISREYHPSALFEAGPFEQDTSGRVVNHIWVIGLVDLALKRILRPERILSVNVRHLKRPLVNQQLRFEMAPASLDPMSEKARLDFTARVDSGELYASGEVIVTTG